MTGADAAGRAPLPPIAAEHRLMAKSGEMDVPVHLPPVPPQRAGVPILGLRSARSD